MPVTHSRELQKRAEIHVSQQTFDKKKCIVKIKFLNEEKNLPRRIFKLDLFSENNTYKIYIPLYKIIELLLISN